MDNIVDYLIAGFFIISFLSSLFKKKKVKESGSKSIEKAPAASQQGNKAIKKKANNPFEEFFSAINQELDKAKKDVSHSEVDEYYEKAFQEPEKAEIKYPDTSNYSQPEKLIQKLESPVKESTIHIKSYSEAVKQSQEQHESKRAKEIKRKLMKTDSIREFVVMNEILGKPKALQK